MNIYIFIFMDKYKIFIYTRMRACACASGYAVLCYWLMGIKKGSVLFAPFCKFFWWYDVRVQVC